MKGLNLAGFEKIKEDKDTVHMKNKDGHVIVLASKALPKIQREQLKRLPMAKGGHVTGFDMNAEQTKSFMEKGEFTNLANGGTLTANDSDLAKGVASTAQGGGNSQVQGIKYDNSKSTWDKVKDLLPGAGPSAEASTISKAKGGEIHDKNCPCGSCPQYFAEGSENIISPASDLARAPVDAIPAQVPSNIPLLSTDKTLNAPQAVNLQQQGAREQQAVDVAKGVATAQTEDAYLKAKAEIAQRDQNAYNDLKSHTDDFKNYMNSNPINPNHYQENMGVGSKIANAFGLLMGGFKQGFSGGNNPAMDYLNAQIQRDIDAQKARGEQQKSVYGAYQSLYGDSVIANNLAKVSMNDIYEHKAKLIAARLGTPQAKATADAFAAQKAIENNQLLLDSSGRLGTLNTGGGSVVQPPQQNQEPNQSSNGIIPASATIYGGKFGIRSNPEEKKEKDVDSVDTPLLLPGAEQHFRNLAYVPKAKDQYEKITEQYTQAQQSQKALDAINEKFPKLRDESTWQQWLAGHINPHVTGTIGAVAGGIGGAIAGATGAIPTGGLSIPAVAGAGATLGGTAGEAAGLGAKGALNTYAGRKGIAYDADKAAITKIIAVALKNAPVGAEQIEAIVNSNTPTAVDSHDTYEKKINNIREFIRQNTPTSLLHTWGLSVK